MSRQQRLVRALVEGLGHAETADGRMTVATVRYHCILASVAAYGPGSTAAAEQAQHLVTEIIAAYAALGFQTRTTAAGDVVYEYQGLAAAAQACAPTR